MIEPLDSNGEQTKGHVHFGESEKGLAQMRLHHELIGNTGDLVHETGQGQSIFVMIGAGGRELLLKGLDRTDDRSMRVVNWNRAHAHRNFVPAFVVEEAGGFGGPCRLDGPGQGTILVARLTVRLLAMQDRVSDTGMADDFMA